MGTNDCYLFVDGFFIGRDMRQCGNKPFLARKTDFLVRNTTVHKLFTNKFSKKWTISSQKFVLYVETFLRGIYPNEKTA